MTIQVANAFVQHVAEQAFTVVAKSAFCSFAYDPIRSNLQTLITKLATPHIGKLASPLVGKSLSSFLSFPVAQIYAELYCCLFYKTIQAIVHVWKLYCNDRIEEVQQAQNSSLKEASIRIAACAVAFFTSIYVTNYGMPFVRTSLEVSVEKLLPLINAPVGSSFIAGQVILIATPTLTFFLSDLAGSFASVTSYSLLDAAWTQLETISIL